MDIHKSYYECKRCFFKAYQKNTMKKHLEKIKSCSRTFESYKYSDNELYDLSLIRIYDKNKDTICNICSKNFKNIFSLNRHKIKCKDTDKDIDKDTDKDKDLDKNSDIKLNNSSINISNSSINNSIIDNSINKNISINIINFNDEWNTSHIDSKQKILLLLKKYKFTTTLENILENEINLNVLIDNTTNNGLVCNNNRFEKMDIKDIVKKTMKKLLDSLNNFKNDISENNDYELDLNILNNEINKVNIKYDEFTNNKYAQNDVNNIIKNIYNKKKDETYNNSIKYQY